MRSRKLLKTLLFALLFAVVLSLIAGFQFLKPEKAEAPQNRIEEKTQQEVNVKQEEPEEAPKLNIKDPVSQYVLVNKQNPLNPLDYRPEDLVADVVPTISSDSAEERSVRGIIKPDLVQMFADAKNQNLSLVMNSGFRSSQKQAFYYNNYVRQSGEAAANRFSAKPGYSEHQTGLSLDISYANRRCYLEECFGETEAGKWLAENAHKYGFILRYPKDKEEITGYQYEPWHFRYVGKEVATEIYEQQTTYEEYLQNLELL